MNETQCFKIINVDLAYLLTTWDSLIEPVKKAIMTLAKSAVA